MRVAAVVVLYNPADEIQENIDSYIDQVDTVYAVDNSDDKNESLINELKQTGKIVYVDNGGNKGIANALNVGANKATEDGYDFLLTMDQDSRVSEKMLSTMLECLGTVDIPTLGILSPFHASKIHTVSREHGCIEKKVVMTSGNLLSLKAYRKTGPFLEELFLDYVDNEYCLRLQRHGYRVIQVSEAILFHKLGELSLRQLFGKNIYCYNYPPVRYYYRARNVIAIHKKLEVAWGTEILRDMIKIFLYEKNKLQKFLYICYGMIDAIQGKMGKYDR
ncbi:glycosyltransferase family 2 protein [Sulfurovum lithotrophicum]|uniref:glycosyltransferase family 2 protein n=1 Tax=Sulfurovum lithotrophicum TaxID=206403 RepID=UPI0006976FA3|nr:glycosyltransferase family 2 protein [Sulfurovum lithotrophicum]